MIRGVLVIVAIGCWFSSFGQSVPQLREIATRHFELAQYTEAIEFYEKISRLDKRDHQSKYRLGLSLYRTLQYDEAKEHFIKIAADTSQFKHLAVYYYGTILKLESDFAEADSVFAFLMTQPNVDDELLELGRKQKEGCQLALNHEEQDRGFTIEEMTGLNSKFHDFGGVVNGRENSVVFVTTRNLQSKQYEGLQYDGLLPDLTQFRKRGNNWRNISNRDRFDNLNTEWSEGSGSFTANDSSFYFTSCRSNDGGDCKIMVSHYTGGRWGKPQALNEYINLPGFESKHPFITNLGDTLFFVSDREGGHGADDIWMSISGTDQDSWTPAINLGDIINTASNDITPYYSSAFNCLLFSSDGHVGYGGFDIFAAKGQSFFEPEIYNLGDPFNTPSDDTYFSISDTVGFISSNRNDLRHLNLYSFNVRDERLYLSLLITGESLIDSRIVSRYREIRTLDLITFRVEDYQGFDLFEPVKREKPRPAILDEIEQQQVDLIAGDVPNRTDVDQSAGGALQRLGTVPDGVTLERQITGTDIVSEALLASFSKSNFEKVYFEFASTDLTKQAKLSLDNLINQVKGRMDDVQYIQVVASTDDVGSDQSNLKLSANRGNAVRDYLSSKGYPANRVIIDAKGESNLVTNGTSWYERFFDRRAEIFIYSNRPLTFDQSKKLLVRKTMAVTDASQILKISPDKIKIWNEMSEDSLSAGDVIRIDEPVFTSSVKYFLDETDVKNKFFPYIVEEGETIAAVARKFRTPEELLVEINQLENEVSPGDVVFVYNRNRTSTN